jgi:hypothetical protein
MQQSKTNPKALQPETRLQTHLSSPASLGNQSSYCTTWTRSMVAGILSTRRWSRNVPCTGRRRNGGRDAIA